MELVNSGKLKAVAELITGVEIGSSGIAPCSYFNNFLKGDKVDVPCNAEDCEDWCPFYNKENFIHWMKEPDKKISVQDLKKPKIEDFIDDPERNGSDGCTIIVYEDEEEEYYKVLEKYCDDLENVLADTEYDLEEAECENRELKDALEKIRGVLK